MSIKEWPEGERPREKLLERGAAALSDAELLAILLRVGTRGMSAVDLARYLLSEFGSLGKLMSADSKTLSACKGMGLASYTQFAVVKEIGRRILGEELQKQIVLSNPKCSARPSESDVQFTERLKQALSLVDITLLDHFIVTAKETCSLREQGYM